MRMLDVETLVRGCTSYQQDYSVIDFSEQFPLYQPEITRKHTFRSSLGNSLIVEIIEARVIGAEYDAVRASAIFVFAGADLMQYGCVGRFFFNSRHHLFGGNNFYGAGLHLLNFFNGIDLFREVAFLHQKSPFFH